jgi:serine/threonine protein kinase
MIVDFGISVVKIDPRSGFLAADMYGDGGQTTASVTTSPRYSSDFHPPELQSRLPMIHTDNDTRKGDIWSFGCILTEVFVFSLGGSSLVIKLRTINNCEDQTGPFHSAAEHEMPAIYKVKKQVKTWVRQTSVHQDSWACDWFNLIFDYMLQIAPTQRHGANRIQEQLDSIWRHAPTENLWPRLSQHLDFPSHSPSWSNSPNLFPSLVSLLSSELISGHQSSTPEPNPARIPDRDTNEDPLMIVPTSQDDPAPLSPRTTGSTEDTITLGSPHRLPAIEKNLRDELPDADDITICSDSTRVIFWTGRNVIPFTIMSSTFFRETNDIANVSLQTNPPAEWIGASLSGPYLALAKSSPSSMQVGILPSVFKGTGGLLTHQR